MTERSDRRRMVLRAMAGSIAVPLLSGCSAIQVEVDEDDGGEGDDSSGDDVDQQNRSSPTSNVRFLNVGLSAFPEGLDPIRIERGPGVGIVNALFEGLYEYGASTALEPRLAAGQPETSRDGTRWIVGLRSGPRFQNGTPLGVEDVVYSYEAAMEESPINQEPFEIIESVTAVDESTIQFDLRSAFVPFRHLLTQKVVPESVRTGNVEAFSNQPVGSGPFRYAPDEQDSGVRIVRWDRYWGDRHPRVEGVAFVPYDAEAITPEAFANRTFEIVEGVHGDRWSTLRGSEQVAIETVPRMVYFYLAFNCKEGPTVNRSVREAVDYAFDMEAAVAEATGRVGIRQFSPLPKPVADNWGMPVDAWRTIPHDRNPNRTATLLEAAGVPRNYPWKVIVPPDAVRESIARQVIDGLAEAGWTNGTVERLNWGRFLSQFNTGAADDYNMFMLGWRNIPDPHGFTYPLFSREPNVLGITNGVFYGANTERGRAVSATLERAKTTLQRSRRQRLYEEAITTILEDRVHLPAYNLLSSFAVHSVVEGFQPSPTHRRFNLFGATANTGLSTER